MHPGSAPRSSRWTALGLAVLLVTAACGAAGQPGPTDGAPLSGDVRIDGSSTVFPITEAMAEEFQRDHPDVRITVGISGTGGGFKKFCNGETDISDASRPIRDSEREECERNGIDFVDLQVAIDGLSVVVHPQNDWASCLTTAELRAIWDTGSTIDNWRDVRPGFPDVELRLFAPGADSGTFDYFTEVINGREKQSRSDATFSEDDNVLVQGVAGSRGGLGYLGYAYYIENTARLKLVAVDGGDGCVEPTDETVADGDYTPLARPIFIYVRTDSTQRPEVYEFVKWYLSTESRELIGEVGYLPAPDHVYEDALASLEGARRQ